MTQMTSEQQVKRCLDKDETLIWAGRPDQKAFQKGLVRPYFLTTHNALLDNRLFRMLVKAIVLIAFLIFIVISLFSKDGVIVLPTSFDVKSEFLWILVLPLLYIGFNYLNTLRRNGWKSRGYAHAEALTYGITNKRLLILRNGVIEEDFTVSEVSPKLNERLNAPGFGDIIWGQRALPHSNTGKRSRPSPYIIELSRIGFKALPDAESVLQKIVTWRQHQIEEVAQESEAFLNHGEQAPKNARTDTTLGVAENAIAANSHQSGKNKANKSSSEIQDVRRTLHNTSMGFSIDFPEQWDVKIRKRRLAFGKWGIEKEAVWSDEGELRQWNVIKVESQLGSKVEVQVHKIKPINTFEKLVGANNPISGLLDLFDQNPDFQVNGLKGFYVTRLTSAENSLLSKIAYAGETFTRLHVFHDGEKQYYVESNWRKDSPMEAKLCEMIVSSLQAG